MGNFQTWSAARVHINILIFLFVRAGIQGVWLALQTDSSPRRQGVCPHPLRPHGTSLDDPPGPQAPARKFLDHCGDPQPQLPVYA